MSDVVIAVVGLGYWGPNLLRNAWELEHVRVKSICDTIWNIATPISTSTGAVAVSTPVNGIPVPLLERMAGLTITTYIVTDVVRPPMTSGLSRL